MNEGVRLSNRHPSVSHDTSQNTVIIRYTNSMQIPHTKLSPATLRAIVQEFVTRDGTDYSSIERRIESVLRQLDAGRVVLHFDDQTETCNIVTVEGGETRHRTM